MKTPQNYDFAANWKSKIGPHLDDPIIQKSLQIGIDHYLSGFPGNKKYQMNIKKPFTYVLFFFFLAITQIGLSQSSSRFSYNKYGNDKGDTLLYRQLFPDSDTFRRYVQAT